MAVSSTVLAAVRFAPALRHGLSFQVACSEQIFAKDHFGIRQPPGLEVERNLVWLTGLLAERQVTATFFVLGCVARAFPRSIRTLHEKGHEIALLGDEHHLLNSLTPEEFRDDLARAAKSVNWATGAHLRGYRAPGSSLGPSTRWAIDLLLEAGLTYDSSLSAEAVARLGAEPVVSAPVLRWPGGLIEIPRTPSSSGAMASVAASERAAKPAVLGFDLSDFELSRPRMPPRLAGRVGWGRRLASVPHLLLGGTRRGAAKRALLERLLDTYRFAPLENLLAGIEATPAGVSSTEGTCGRTDPSAGSTGTAAVGEERTILSERPSARRRQAGR